MPERDFYSLLMRLGRQVTREQLNSITGSRHSELSASELSLLRCIKTGSKPGEVGPTMSEIAGMLNITQGTLTVAVNRMVRKGYVERVRMEQDRRVVILSLTDSGTAALNEDRAFRRKLQQQFEAALGQEAAAAFMKEMVKLEQAFSDKEEN